MEPADISDPVYAKNRNSYGKVNRNRQMYILDNDLIESTLCNNDGSSI